MDLGLERRVFLITGGSSGLGFATAQVLVAEGARVVLAARTGSRLREATAALGGPTVAAGWTGDLADPDAATGMVELCMDRFGGLDGALLSVGGPPAATVLEASDDLWRHAFESAFLGVLRTARTVIAGLGEGGSVVFVLSSSVRSPIPGLALSNGLRPGLAMVAKTLADEVGTRGVRVNAVLPGRISTERLSSLDASHAPAEVAAARAAVPLGRDGLPEELGRVAAFLLSPAASYVTGTTVAVDGGAARGL
jgi:3-oxoacyl-[acyl-carrier protein] reductase